MKKFEIKKSTHFVLKNDDVFKYLSQEEIDFLDKIDKKIYDGRKALGKEQINKYYICNQDEDYSQEVFNLIKENILINSIVGVNWIGCETEESFIIDKEAFDYLFSELSSMHEGHYPLTEDDVAFKLLTGWVNEIHGLRVYDMEITNWYSAKEIPNENETSYFKKDEEGKYYLFEMSYETE